MKEILSTVVEFDIANHAYKIISFDEYFSAPEPSSTKFHWIHCNTSQSAIFQTLTEHLKLSPSILRLCNGELMPAFFYTEKDLTLRIRCLTSTKISMHHSTHSGNLILHLTANYCLTFSEEPFSAIQTLLDNVSQLVKYAQTPCSVLFVLLDNIINDYSSVLFNFESDIEQMDPRKHSSIDHFYTILTLNGRQLMKVKRYMSAIRDILMRVSGRKIPVISPECRLSLGHLFDHSIMIIGETNALWDFLTSIMSQVNHILTYKMSKSMKIVSSFASIFLPLTVITGVYGMNFKWMPELSWKYGYFWALSLMGVSAFFLIWLFRKKDWL